LWLHGSNEIRVGPFLVRFDPRERVLSKRLILRGGHESRELELLCSIVRPGDQVLDAGANVGIYSLFLSRAVGPTGRVVAVEPDPDNLEFLRFNLKINGCGNVTVCPCALGTSSGTVELYQVDDHRGNLSLADLGKTGRSIPVTQRRGGDVLAELGLRPRVAKIDVEGAEPQVLEGLGYTPEVIIFEFVPHQLQALGNRLPPRANECTTSSEPFPPISQKFGAEVASSSSFMPIPSARQTGQLD
jgi:FkbM family methyltransferase